MEEYDWCFWTHVWWKGTNLNWPSKAPNLLHQVLLFQTLFSIQYPSVEALLVFFRCQNVIIFNVRSILFSKRGQIAFMFLRNWETFICLKLPNSKRKLGIQVSARLCGIHVSARLCSTDLTKELSGNRLIETWSNFGCWPILSLRSTHSTIPVIETSSNLTNSQVIRSVVSTCIFFGRGIPSDHSLVVRRRLWWWIVDRTRHKP